MSKNNKGRNGGDRATLKAFDGFNANGMAWRNGGGQWAIPHQWHL